MREKNGNLVKVFLTILLCILTIILGFRIERTRMADTKELKAVPGMTVSGSATVPAVAVSGGSVGDTVSGAVCYGPQEEEPIQAGIKKLKPELLPTPTPVPTPIPTPSVGADETERIASYFQGSASWKSGLTWSGDWGKKKYKGKKFGAFGCGLCCMANIYSSLSPYRCSPLDMYEYAKEVSDYKGAGAIEWWNIQDTLSKAGFTCETGKKPDEYEDFQRLVKKSKAMIILVSNDNKKSMWDSTTGHYATIFLYDKATDRVFLTDSGSYERNRTWVPLKKIYNSLKTKSDHQYLSVTSYHKQEDTWRNTEFTGECKFPSNWVTDS